MKINHNFWIKIRSQDHKGLLLLLKKYSMLRSLIHLNLSFVPVSFSGWSWILSPARTHSLVPHALPSRVYSKTRPQRLPDGLLRSSFSVLFPHVSSRLTLRMTRGSLPWLCFWAAPLSTTAWAPSTTRPWSSCSILAGPEMPCLSECSGLHTAALTCLVTVWLLVGQRRPRAAKALYCYLFLIRKSWEHAWEFTFP